jgi:hypothetical protein
VFVQAARVRHHPDGGAAERIRLTSDPRLRPGEGSPVGRDSQYRHHCRSDAFDALGQRLGSSDELLCGEFVRARRRSRNEGGDAEATLMQMCKVFGKKARGSIYPPIDDARPVESGIEAVAPAAAPDMRLAVRANGANSPSHHNATRIGVGRVRIGVAGSRSRREVRRKVTRG